MEEKIIYPGASNNILLIVLGLIMTVASLLVAVLGHKFLINHMSPMIIGLGLGYTMILIFQMRNRNKAPKMKIYSSFKREVATFIAFYAFAAIIMAFFPLGVNIIGIIGTLLSGLVLIFSILNIVKKSPSLIFKEDSFIDRSSLLSIGEIKYSETKDIFIYTSTGNKQLIIVVDNIKEKIEKLDPVKKVLLMFSKDYIIIPSNRVDMSLEDLEDLFKANQVRCGE
jgi:hypothetical protein